MTILEMAADLRKKAARVKRAVFSGRYYRKHDLPNETHEREQGYLAYAAAAEAIARTADALAALEAEVR